MRCPRSLAEKNGREMQHKSSNISPCSTKGLFFSSIGEIDNAIARTRFESMAHLMLISNLLVADELHAKGLYTPCASRLVVSWVINLHISTPFLASSLKRHLESVGTLDGNSPAFRNQKVVARIFGPDSKKTIPMIHLYYFAPLFPYSWHYWCYITKKKKKSRLIPFFISAPLLQKAPPMAAAVNSHSPPGHLFHTPPLLTVQTCELRMLANVGCNVNMSKVNAPLCSNLIVFCLFLTSSQQSWYPSGWFVRCFNLTKGKLTKTPWAHEEHEGTEHDKRAIDHALTFFHAPLSHYLFAYCFVAKHRSPMGPIPEERRV